MAVDRTRDGAYRQFLEQLAVERRDADVDYDAVVVGTGFGGAVTACRLVEAGYKVCILERGRRYGAADFPTYPTEDLFATSGSAAHQFAPPPDFSRWLWTQDHGLYDVRNLGGSVVLQAAGYGGGSLIYANVHLRPPKALFDEWPQPYSGALLEPYFDLAASMLGAAPIPQCLAKTLQLQRAAKANPESWFRTPLAVNFTRTGRNAYGRDQNPCDMRARCWRGCDHQAKNTLDLNYLARAENGGCFILTMAEVKKITRTGRALTVRYNDLLRPEARRDGAANDMGSLEVTALNVFLCAGAINTTELLFHSRDEVSKDDQWKKTLRILGSRYFPNSDSLAAVFDCDQPHEADYGPTITAAILYDQSEDRSDFRSLAFGDGVSTMPGPVAGTTVVRRHGDKILAIATLAHAPIVDWGKWTEGDEADGTLILTEIKGGFDADDLLAFELDGKVVGKATARSALTAERHWFLVQDGGYPTDLEPLAGVFRSPLWIRRNRYLETPETPSSAATVDPSSSPPSTAAPLRRPATSQLRVGVFAEALGGTSAGALRGEGVIRREFAPGRSMADAGSRGIERELLLPGLLSKPIGDMFPKFFIDAIRNDRVELLAQAAALAVPMLNRILDDLSATLTSQIDPETRARLSGGQIDDRQVEVLARGLVRQVLQILAGSEVTLATKAAQALLNPIPETPGQLVNLVANAALWALGYNENVGHTAVLLTMGRDNYRGRLHCGDAHDQPIQAKLPARVIDTAGAAHERVLREIALQWGGELRTNPGWTTLGQRVSVHNQGGCPMGEPGRSVTSSDGEVHGCEGLYVMDAAAFPTSVGVNPSATIAAVAEYKVEQFIRKRLPEWRTPDHAGVDEWIKSNGGREAIDPLNAQNVTSRPAPSEHVNVLGLTFDEELEGFCAEISSRDHDSIRFTPLSNFPKKEELTTFLQAEDYSIARRRQAISVALHVKVPDLARLVEGGRELSPMKIQLSGEVKLKGPKNKAVTIDSKTSFLQIFINPNQPGDKRRFFHYHLRAGQGETGVVLDGVKVLCDEPGFDAWHDTSTLYVQISEPDRWQRGVLRVSIERFLQKQMPSMLITGTNDPARQSWALLAFYKYFAGELAEIYMKRAEAFKDALIKLVTSIHV